MRAAARQLAHLDPCRPGLAPHARQSVDVLGGLFEALVLLQAADQLGARVSLVIVQPFRARQHSQIPAPIRQHAPTAMTIPTMTVVAERWRWWGGAGRQVLPGQNSLDC